MKKPLRIAITIALISAVFWYIGDIRQIFDVLKRADPLLTLAALIAITLDRALMAYKWIYLLHSHNQPLAFLNGMKIYCAAAMWGIALPSTIGADAIRTYLTVRTGLDSKTVITSIIVERMIGFIASLILALISIGILNSQINLDDKFNSLLWLAALLLIASIGIFAMSFSRHLYRLMHDKWLKRFSNISVFGKLERLHQSYLNYALKKKELGIFFGMSFAEQFFSFIISWLIAQSLGVDVGLLFLAGVIPVTLLLARLPISVDGIGVVEAIFVLAMSAVGIAPAEAVSIAFGARILQIIAWLPWWFAHMIENRQFSIKVPEAGN